MRLLLIILGVICIGGGALWKINSEQIVLPIATILLGVVFLFGIFCVAIVPSGHVGIRSKYQQIQGEPLKSGQYWMFPFTNQIDLVNCKQQERTFNETVSGESSEQTAVYAEGGITVNYQINAEYAAWIWTNIEEWDYNLIKGSTVQTAIRSATRQLPNKTVTDRSYINPLATECLQKELNKKYGKPILTVLSVEINNMRFNEEYENALDARDLARITAETEEYNKQQKIKKAEGEAEETKIKAEAQAEQAKIKAQGTADAQLITATATAEANKKIADSLTPELIELRKIEAQEIYAKKWNGQQPLVTGADSTIVNTSDLAKTMEILNTSKEEETK